jgi:CBS domain-containing protein
MIKLSVRSWMNGAPLTIGPKDNLRRARALMRTADAPELLVVDQGKLVGLLNEQDVWKHCPTSAIMLEEKQAEELLEQIRVGGVMVLHPPVVTPDTPLREALQLFAQSGRHGLPVVENGVPVGLLTEERVLQAMAAVLGQLEQYTAGRGEA